MAFQFQVRPEPLSSCRCEKLTCMDAGHCYLWIEYNYSAVNFHQVFGCHFVDEETSKYIELPFNEMIFERLSRKSLENSTRLSKNRSMHVCGIRALTEGKSAHLVAVYYAITLLSIQQYCYSLFQ
jgi:hypothetical protein